MAALPPNYDHYIWLGALLVLIAGTRLVREQLQDIPTSNDSRNDPPAPPPTPTEQRISQSSLALLAAHPSIDIRTPAQRILMRRFFASPAHVDDIAAKHLGRDPVAREDADNVLNALVALGMETELDSVWAAIGGRAPGVPQYNGAATLEEMLAEDEEWRVDEILRQAGWDEEVVASVEGRVVVEEARVVEGEEDEPRAPSAPPGHRLRRVPRLLTGSTRSERVWGNNTLAEAVSGLWFGAIIVQPEQGEDLSPEEQELMRREGREAVERSRRRGAVVIGGSMDASPLEMVDGPGARAWLEDGDLD